MRTPQQSGRSSGAGHTAGYGTSRSTAGYGTPRGTSQRSTGYGMPGGTSQRSAGYGMPRGTSREPAYAMRMQPGQRPQPGVGHPSRAQPGMPRTGAYGGWPGSDRRSSPRPGTYPVREDRYRWRRHDWGYPVYGGETTIEDTVVVTDGAPSAAAAMGPAPPLHMAWQEPMPLDAAIGQPGAVRRLPVTPAQLHALLAD